MFNPSTLTRQLRVASAFSLAALLSVGIWMPAQAAPDPNPPARTDIDRNRRDDRFRVAALRGTVDRVFSARSFDLRSDDGRIYRVNMRVPVGLQTQSNVRVMGDLNGSTFEARAITIGDFADDRTDNYGNGGYNNGPNDGYGNGDYNGAPNDGNGNNNGYDPNRPNYQGQQVTLQGRITRLYGRTDFEVRDDDDGRIFRVRTDTPLSNNLREGDRIEARGELNGTTIRANSAVAIGNNGSNNGGFGNNGNVGNNGGFGNNGNVGNNGNAVPVNFSGPILSLDLNREEATVRAGNSYIYTLRARRSTLDNFRVGQRVRVQGNWINQRVEVTSLSRE